MNRLNGPFKCLRIGDEYHVMDKFDERLATCFCVYHGDMLTQVLNEVWMRQAAAIEVAERVERE